MFLSWVICAHILQHAAYVHTAVDHGMYWQSTHACKFCAQSTCLGYLQILVLGFCDNQRDEELIWKILSQVLSAPCFMHISGGISMPIMSHLVAGGTTSAACSVHLCGAISMTVMYQFVAGGKNFYSMLCAWF